MLKFFRFCVIGVANTCLNYLVFYLCLVQYDIHVLLAGAIGFSSAIFPAYLLNRVWSFKSDSPFFLGLIKYTLINIVTLMVHLFVIWIVTSVFDITAIWSQAFGIVITTPISFFLLCRFIFHQNIVDRGLIKNG
jgi:putative flippase GtrA